ncbi:hypothetical protein CP532_6191 [Ophiocordyceps camponoti-leonardi (nom. inval.)]|nr:hypothetical protein CP532_6191 [Ophiocordyceps camponoti-leonardi (nom. inval.)]
MKSFLVSCLLIGGSVRGQTVAAPSCVAECTKALEKQSGSPTEAMRAICGDMTGQRAMFQCLIKSCHGGSYGPALGHVASACSRLGNDIGPLHPIEVHYAPQKRQIIPTAPGPVLPGPSTVYNTQILNFSHRLSMALECMAGADGVLTVAVNAPDSATTPGATHDAGLGAPGAGGSSNAPATQTSPHQGHDGNADCTSSLATSPVGVDPSSTSALGQETGCPCHDPVSSSSLFPNSQLGSASLLQGPTEQQSASLPSSTPAPILTGYPHGTDGKDCKTGTQGNFTTVAPGRGSATPLPASVTSASLPVESVECPESMSGLAATAAGFSRAPNATTTPTGSVTTVATLLELIGDACNANFSSSFGRNDFCCGLGLIKLCCRLGVIKFCCTFDRVVLFRSVGFADISHGFGRANYPCSHSHADVSCSVDTIRDGQAGERDFVAQLLSIGLPPAETTSCSSEEGGSAGVQGMGTAPEQQPVPANVTAVLTHHSTSTVAAISSTPMASSSAGSSLIHLTSLMPSARPHLNSSSVAASEASSATSAAPGASSSPSSAATSFAASPVTSLSPSLAPTSAASSDVSSPSSAHTSSSALPDHSGTSSFLGASSTHLTESTEHSSPPAYVTPLPGYTYHGPAPEYVTLGASVTGSSTTHGPSMPAEEIETGGIMGSQVQHTTTQGPDVSGHASSHPDSYERKTSALQDSAPVQTQFPADAALRRRFAQHDGGHGGIDKTGAPANETQGKTSGAASRSTTLAKGWVLAVLLTVMILGAVGR